MYKGIIMYTSVHKSKHTMASSSIHFGKKRMLDLSMPIISICKPSKATQRPDGKPSPICWSVKSPRGGHTKPFAHSSTYGSFLKWGYHQKKPYTLNNVNMIFHYKPSILGYPHLWKYPYQQTSADRSRRLMNPNQAPGSTNGPPCFCHLDAHG